MKFSNKLFSAFGFAAILSTSLVMNSFAADKLGHDQSQEQSQSQDQGQSQEQSQDQAIVNPKSVATDFLDSLVGYYHGARQQSDSWPHSGQISTTQFRVYPIVFKTGGDQWTFRWVGCDAYGACYNNDTSIVEVSDTLYLDANGDGKTLIPARYVEATPTSLVQRYSYKLSNGVTQDVTLYDSLYKNQFTRNIVIRHDGKIHRDLYYVLLGINPLASKHSPASQSRMKF